MDTIDVTVPNDIARDLVNPDAYADGRIHTAYRWLRANNPLGAVEAPGFDRFWAITRHADVLQVSRNNALFHSGDRAATLVTRSLDAQIRRVTGGSPHLLRSIVQMDAPEHAKYRALSLGWFSPASISKLEPEIRSMAKAQVARMATLGGRCEFAADVALGFPLRVIMKILGVPESDEPRMMMITQQLLGGQSEEQMAAAAALPPEQLAAIINATVKDIDAYFAAISAQRRMEPKEDLATVIANAQIDGEPITDRDATGYYTIVATAGHDTTSSSIAGGMAMLASDPALLARLRSDPALTQVSWTRPSVGRRP